MPHTPHRSRRAVRLVGVVAVAAAAGACSGGESAAGTTAAATTVAVSAAAATTTPAPTTAAATTTEPARWPLTGLVAPGADDLAHPALVVKVDNAPAARPQVGLGQADIVFEEIVEGITRFAAVFHSTMSDPVGPIRSARTQDVAITANLNRPLFAFSGGNAGVMAAVKKANVQDVSHTPAAQFYYRDTKRPAPHNLFSSTTDLLTLADSDRSAPSLFLFRRSGDPAAGSPAVGVHLDMRGFPVDYRWDATAGGWRRAHGTTPHVDADDEPIAPENVVILVVTYKRSPADPGSPEAQTIGSGEAWVLTGGNRVTGTWSRADGEAPYQLLDDAGHPILLTPGRTWVALVEKGDATLLTA